MFDSTIQYDVNFFRSLDRVVQSEPWLARDRALIDTLKTLGIEKGKTFAPDAATTTAMTAALAEARAWFDMKYEAFPPLYEGKQWFFAASPELMRAFGTGFSERDSYPIDDRAVTYYWGFSSIKRVGGEIHQFYPFVDRGADGQALDGAKTHVLHVPPNVPAKQFWSVVVYDRATHALIRDVPRGGRSSLTPEVVKNSDGSVDIYFAPTAPAGKETNWTPTKAGGTFEVIFRMYGAEKAAVDKSWQLPDIVPV